MTDGESPVAPARHDVPLATALARLLTAGALASNHRAVIGVAGESGSGKSVTATGLALALDTLGRICVVLHQDDYFVRPPRANHEFREQNIGNVGPQEVNLTLLAAHVAAFRARQGDVPVPTVDYTEDRFTTRLVDFASADVLIVEGTYVLMLPDLDRRIFFDATAMQTRERRRERNRDIDAPIVEQVLAIEHDLIAPQRAAADILIDSGFNIVRAR